MNARSRSKKSSRYSGERGTYSYGFFVLIVFMCVVVFVNVCFNVLNLIYFVVVILVKLIVNLFSSFSFSFRRVYRAKYTFSK